MVGFPPKSSIEKSGFPLFSPSILGYLNFRKPSYVPNVHTWIVWIILIGFWGPYNGFIRSPSI